MREIRSFSLIFAIFRWELQHFGGADFRRKPQETADFRRKPQIFAETRSASLNVILHDSSWFLGGNATKHFSMFFQCKGRRQFSE